MQFEIVDIEDLPLSLYKARNNQKISQNEIYKGSLLSSIETGKRNASIRLFRKLFDKLGYDLKICLIKRK